MLTRRLIHLLDKLIQQTNELQHQRYKSKIALSPNYQKRFSIIKKVLAQEKELLNGKKATERIASIDRHYLYPIARDKKTKQ